MPSKPGDKRYEFIRKLAQKVRNDADAREIWNNKQVTAHNQRSGIRRRNTRNEPYPGYGEVPIPITDKIIKKLKSFYVSVATQSKKQIVVQLENNLPQPPDARVKANKIEEALNNLVRKRDFQWTKKIALFCDYFLENGHAIFKVIIRFFSKKTNKTISINVFEVVDELENRSLSKKDKIQFLADLEGMDVNNKEDLKELTRVVEKFASGEKEVTIQKRIEFSEPTVIPEKSMRIIVPPGSTDVQNLTRVTHDMWFPLHMLKNKADAGVYDKKVIDGLDEEGGTSDDSLINTAMDISEGVSRKEASGASELYNVRECYTYYEGEKWVFTWIEEAGRTDDNDTERNVRILQETKLPLDHGLWPFVKHDNEYRNARWHSSRGVPEQIRGMHYIMEKMFNARVIRDEYNNNPMFRVSRQVGFTGNEIRFKPGQIIEAEQGEIEQINKAVTADISSERIEQQAKAYVEEYQSITDFSQRSAVNQGGSRTATEIQALQGAVQRQLGTEIAVFLDSLSEVSHQMFLLLKQIVTEPMVVGGVMLEPSDFGINANVSWVGSIESSDQNLQATKALGRIQTLVQVGLPSGIVTQEDLYNAMVDWLSSDVDIEDPDRFITAPQEVQTDQAEDQIQEIMMMENGFNPTVKPNDQHGTHIQVMEQYLNSPIGSNKLKSNPAFAQAFQQHLNIHLEAEKTLKQGGNTNDPRRKRVLQTFDSE